MLAQAEQADVAMAPAADMFEMGVKVQVLKRGHHVRHAGREALRTLPGPRRRSSSIPPADRAQLEKNDLPRPARNDLGPDP